jgi:hypothetical protein
MMDKKKIDFKEGKMDPKDPKNTFLSLTSKTYPHGNEEEVLKYLPELDQDTHGNYYKVVGGGSSTMFTSHLDTADHRQNDTVRFTYTEGDDEFICTDGKTILGADDKAGVTVMLYMMANNVPGLYYFFIGEERGGIGSKALAMDFTNEEHLIGIKRCVSFDRRNYHSIITHQLGRNCCSSEFAKTLCAEFGKNGLKMSPDSTGIFTDSAMFMNDIPECTNVSVGYFDEHTGKERQNISYLDRLCRASTNVDWESLPTSRIVSKDEDTGESEDDEEEVAATKHKKILDRMKRLRSYAGYQLNNTFDVYFDVEGWPIPDTIREINKLKDILTDIDTVNVENGYIIVGL